MSPGHMRTIFASQIRPVSVCKPRVTSSRVHRARTRAYTYMCVSYGATCDGLYSIRPPVNSFFPRAAPGATLLLPGRVTSHAAGSHYHPYLRGFIAPSAQPSSYFPSYPGYIYIGGARIVSRRPIGFSLDSRPRDLSTSVGEPWVPRVLFLSPFLHVSAEYPPHCGYSLTQVFIFRLHVQVLRGEKLPLFSSLFFRNSCHLSMHRC